MPSIEADLLEERSGEAAALLKLMANRHRLLILCYLHEETLSVSSLQSKLSLSQSALSQHLANLRQAGVVSTARKGTEVHYRLADHRVVELLATLQEVICQPEEFIEHKTK
ncbi:metalloregulator ArsR/SmtB family transcription factor [uncultured Umboniibacter sp.]|uniref:ArsR/SmtB family transcription factor n=1 Tax=uncultured Umboniibacter sp. TaxID=1798917 RepID=UPI00261943DD|nr:metalloregulator ArsR/SmtB family transcription factor [uncultured Umboniibacter sp.]